MYCEGCGTALVEDALVEDLTGWEPMVDAEASDWILRAFRWALENYGTDVFYEHTILVTPTSKHFPDHAGDDHQKALMLFDCVRRLSGMQNWPCKLMAQQPDVNPVVDAVTLIQDAPKTPAGTFCISGQEEPEVVITYNPAMVHRPQALVATLAHELAHYLGRTADSPPPGGEKNWEYATDLLAVFTGFGLFLANSAIDFQQFNGYKSHGWSTRKLGYLSEFELVYCLAVFCTLKNIERERLLPYLKPFLIPVYDDCLKDLGRKADIMAELAQIRSTVRRRRIAERFR
jgi:hypothetical protein